MMYRMKINHTAIKCHNNMTPYSYFWLPRYSDDPNITIQCILRFLQQYAAVRLCSAFNIVFVKRIMVCALYSDYDFDK